MSVKLTPINAAKDSETVNICNGTWRAITAAAKAYGEDIDVWNGFHDGQNYTPDQLRKMAARIEQIKDTPEWLRWLAEHGGAVLS